MTIRLIVSINSDIAKFFSEKWAKAGIRVLGLTSSSTALINGVVADDLIRLDLTKTGTDRVLNDWLGDKKIKLNEVIFATGTQEPVGPFFSTNFSEWKHSIHVNTISQLQLLHSIRPFITHGGGVYFFAGAGSNSAPKGYSAYISSKIHLTKMVELLDAEDPDLKYVIIGPGWVQSKIHEATLNSNDQITYSNTSKTRDMYSDPSKFTPMQRILDFFDWAICAPRAAVSGRNFSVVHDDFESTEINDALLRYTNMYKLRRAMNEYGK